MTEFRVWRTIVDRIEDHGGVVIAACPPGSSVYDYKKFCLIDPITGKRDEPDILFALDGILYFVECKPTLRSSCARGLKRGSDESDIDKLFRIKEAYEANHYDKQLLENYGVDIRKYRMKIGIGYSTKHDNILPMIGVTQFVVTNDYCMKIVGG